MKLSLVKSIEVIAIIAVISGLFGLGYQKGLIMSMGFGNASGSYELREIFNSSTLALFYVFNQLESSDFIKDMMSNWKLIFLYSLSVGVIFFVLAYSRKKLKNENKKVEFCRKKLSNIGDSCKKSFLFGSIIGAVGYIITVLSGYIILISLSLLVFPSALGVLVATSQMNSLKAKDVCVSADEIKSEFIHQCTQISINGKKLTGYIVLENKDGYFVRRNDSFVFISKDGRNCLSSKFILKESLEGITDFSFDDSDIQEFCGITNS